jgi:GMP synthase-like glutamine amidotransferase
LAGARNPFYRRSDCKGQTGSRICLGAQLIAKAFGASVYKNPYREIGWFPVERINSSEQNWEKTLLPEQAEVFHWHGETFELPKGAIHLASSKACPNQAFLFEKRILGLQFHLEITREGVEMLIQHCKPDLTYGLRSLYTDRTSFCGMSSIFNAFIH